MNFWLPARAREPTHRGISASLVQTIEEVMGHEPFSKPVFLKLHRTGNYQARNALEALEYLERYWSGPHSSHYRHAARICRSAIEGLIGAESVRLALIDAAQRSDLLAQKGEVEGRAAKTSYVAVETPQVMGTV